LTAAVDSHWRGAYDLLVVPPGAKTLTNTSAGLVEPNFLGYASSGSITLDQLAAVRALPGVEIAAPIGVVGYVSSQVVDPSYVMTTFPPKPTLYHLVLTLSSTDGLQQIVLNRQEADLLVGPTQANGLNWVDTNASGSGGNGDAIRSSFSALPQLRTELIAIDPTAEMALLGSQSSSLAALAGAFFRGSLSSPYFDCSTDEAALKLLGTSGCSPNPISAPTVPVLISRDLYTPLTLRLDVTQEGKPLARMPSMSQPTAQILAEAKQQAGSGLQDLGSTVRDVSHDILPFTGSGDLSVLFPGDPPPNDQGSFQNAPEFVEAYVPNRPTYHSIGARPGSDLPTLALTSVGAVNADGDLVEPSASQQAGVEAGYRTLVQVPLQAAHAGATGPANELTIQSVGNGFEASDLLPPSDPLDYVPFGAYDPPTSVLVAAPNGKAVPPVAIHPTLNPAGFIDTPPLAITDLLGGTLLRGKTPIDAIRVRVGGLGAFDAQAQAALEGVANEIRGLGLDVEIVAGSSPQSVELYVPSYFVDEAPPADLGYVEQSWTTLGAAQRVSNGLGDADVLLLVAALCVAVVLASAVELVRAVTRVRDVSVLRSVGWGPPRILAWLTSEGGFAGVLVGLVAVLAWAIGGRSSLALGAGLGLALTMPLAAFVGSLLAVRERAPAASQAGDLWLGFPFVRRLRVTGPVSIGLRSALIRPLRSLLIAGALGLASAASSLGILVVLGVTTRVGPTRLGVALATDLRPAQIGLLALTISAGFLAAFLLLRLEANDRATESIVLRAAGWSPRQVALTGHAYRVAVAVVAAISGAGIAATMAVPVALADPASASAIASVAAGSVVVWGGLTAISRSRVVERGRLGP
jgi:hypothetical protein